jgi:ankyrin repeat protein
MNTSETHTLAFLRFAAPIAIAAMIFTGCEKASEETSSDTGGKDKLVAANSADAKAKIVTSPEMKPTVIDRAITLDRSKNLPTAPATLKVAPSKDSRNVPIKSVLSNSEATQLDLTFEPESLQLGMMQPGVPKTGVIMITNNGKTPVQIKKAIASCGCTTPNWPREPIGPGESAELEITLKPSIKQGQSLSKRVTLQMMDGPPQVLKVEGEVGLFVKVSPSFLDASKKKDSDQAMIIMDSEDEIEFSIVSVDPDVTNGFSPDKSLHHELGFDWDKWEKLGRRPQIKIRTDHPNAPEMSMTVRRAIDPNRPRPLPTNQTASRSQLTSAAQQDNVEAVKIALSSKTVEIDDNSGLGGMSAYHWAAKNGNADITQLLIDASANPNVTNKVGKTPVAIAAESGHVEVLKMIVESGGDIESVDQIGGTPLLWASGLSKNPATVGYLIEVGGNVNIIDTNGMTPLIWAAGIGNPESVRLLIENGADVNISEIHQKETALMRAARIAQPQTMAFILEASPDLEMKNALGHTAFMIAAASAPVEKLQMLADKGAKVDVTDIRGWTAMDHAKTRPDGNREEVIAYLGTVMPAGK